jgi:hypothetical protein
MEGEKMEPEIKTEIKPEVKPPENDIAKLQKDISSMKALIMIMFCAILITMIVSSLSLRQLLVIEEMPQLSPNSPFCYGFDANGSKVFGVDEPKISSVCSWYKPTLNLSNISAG